MLIKWKIIKDESKLQKDLGEQLIPIFCLWQTDFASLIQRIVGAKYYYCSISCIVYVHKFTLHYSLIIKQRFFTIFTIPGNAAALKVGWIRNFAKIRNKKLREMISPNFVDEYREISRNNSTKFRETFSIWWPKSGARSKSNRTKLKKVKKIQGDMRKSYTFHN
jgi:hypothetical protein